ncbi:MAG: hypothetical protein EOS76_30180 [Mesorhizobium sp.]|uniref:hypothetical protein n=1 Tax=Mesorhizobium sp. TaxID=1871066 RepID=UPI000FE9C7E9|nr:hypothetical protein [Mesorhizobium sp.]RWE06818.1 MAG: hypothetical protein EOS76_30180 [Mesorhizobium sp.]
MSAEDQLARLREHAQSLEQSIENIDHEINATIGHEGSARLIDYLRERHTVQLGYMYDLGKVERQIEDLENLVSEQREQPQEQRLAEKWQESHPAPQEDHLDWFKQSLAENPPQMDELEQAEQRMVQDMEREPTRDDHLDWFSERR